MIARPSSAVQFDGVAPQRQEVFGLFRSILTDAASRRFERTAEVKRYRGRIPIYTTVVILWLMIYQRLSAKHTLSTAVKSLQAGLFKKLHGSAWQEKCQTMSLGTSGFSQAREYLPVSLVNGVADLINGRLMEQLGDRFKWYGRQVFIADGSTLSAPHEDDILKRFPASRNKHECYWPMMRIVTCHHLLSGVATRPSLGAMYGPNRVSEQVLFKKQVSQLPINSIIVADGNFGTFACTFHAVSAGHDVVVRLSSPRAERILRSNDLAGKDGAVLWTPSEGDTRNNLELSKQSSITGRIIRATVKLLYQQEREIFIFTTTRHSPEKIASLYAKRWSIETDLRTIKSTVDMRVLNCKSADMAEKEAVVGILAYSLVRATMALAALRAGVEPRSLSFSNAVDVLHAYLPAISRVKSVNEVIDLTEQILQRIAQCAISPRKNKRLPQPRIKRSRTTPYRISNKPRNILVEAMFLKMAID